MTSFRRLSLLALGTGLFASSIFAQSVISAHSGLIHYVEGEAFIGDKVISPKFGEFPDLKEGNHFRTAEGRAEILLTPGVFLRLAENSEIRMITNRLIDTRVELISGSILIECAEILKDNNVTFAYKDATIEFPKKGLFRLDADGSGSLKVYNGEAIVSANKEVGTVKEGKETQLAGMISPEKFDNKTGDSFYRWAARRSGTLSVANLSAAKTLRDSGTTLGSSVWQYNPYFGMFSFIPMSGMYNSPFGYSYYSPYSVLRIYNYTRNNGSGWAGNTYNGSTGTASNNSVRYDSSLGYNTVSRNSPAFQSAAPSASVGAPSNAASVSSSRGADSSGGASRGGTGRGGR
jgi:hypothetical protein